MQNAQVCTGDMRMTRCTQGLFATLGTPLTSQFGEMPLAATLFQAACWLYQGTGNADELFAMFLLSGLVASDSAPLAVAWSHSARRRLGPHHNDLVWFALAPPHRRCGGAGYAHFGERFVL